MAAQNDIEILRLGASLLGCKNHSPRGESTMHTKAHETNYVVATLEFAFPSEIESAKETIEIFRTKQPTRRAIGYLYPHTNAWLQREGCNQANTRVLDFEFNVRTGGNADAAFRFALDIASQASSLAVGRHPFSVAVFVWPNCDDHPRQQSSPFQHQVALFGSHTDGKD